MVPVSSDVGKRSFTGKPIVVFVSKFFVVKSLFIMRYQGFGKALRIQPVASAGAQVVRNPTKDLGHSKNICSSR